MLKKELENYVEELIKEIRKKNRTISIQSERIAELKDDLRLYRSHLATMTTGLEKSTEAVAHIVSDLKRR